MPTWCFSPVQNSVVQKYKNTKHAEIQKYTIHNTQYKYTNKQINKEKQTCQPGASPQYSAVQKYKNTTKYKTPKYTKQIHIRQIKYQQTYLPGASPVQDSAMQKYTNTQIQNENTQTQIKIYLVLLQYIQYNTIFNIHIIQILSSLSGKY